MIISFLKHREKIGFSKFYVCKLSTAAVFNKENSFLSDLSFESNFKIESNLEFPNSVGKKLREIRLQSKVYFKLPSGLIHPWTTRQSRLARWDTSKTVQNLHFHMKYNATSSFSMTPQVQGVFFKRSRPKSSKCWRWQNPY